MFVLRGINKFLMHVEKFIVVLTGIGLVVSICVQVIGRYILQVPTPWAEEIARYLFIWMVLVGAGYVLAIKDHIEIAILDQLLEKLKNPDKAKRYCL
jgi:TRAP-type C4-dicarboxylate transport system permease small subunit